MQHSSWPSVHVTAPHAAPGPIAASTVVIEPSLTGPSAGEGASIFVLPPPPSSPPHAISATASTSVLSMGASIGDPGAARDDLFAHRTNCPHELHAAPRARATLRRLRRGTTRATRRGDRSH